MEPSGPSKRLRLRRPDHCVRCGREFNAGEEAVWYREPKVVTCVACAPVGEAAAAAPAAIEPEALDEPYVQAGTAGASARREYDRRRQKREDHARAKLGRVGVVLARIGDEPQSTRAWDKGAKGEAFAGVVNVLPDASVEGAVSTGRGALLRRGVQLEIFTIVWVAIEAIGALVAAAQAGSVALLAFGIDSVIEFVAAAVVLRRFRYEQSGQQGSASDRRALRLIGASFVALAVYVLVDAVITLVNASHPDSSALGLAIAGCALVVMPALAVAKRRTGRLLRSRALIADAAETLACAWLSGAAVLGVGLNAAFGWWWADPAAALLLVPLILTEAREAFEDDEDR